MITAHDLADVERRAWSRRTEYHLGLVPKLLGAMLELAAPTVGVSRGGSRFDRPQITGGGYHDETPTGQVDERAAGDATYLWGLLAEYATALSAWLGAETRIPAQCPGSSQAAHDAALLIIGTLLNHADQVYEFAEMARFEAEMFAEIRRQQRRYLPEHDGVPQHARDCTVCGESRAVRVVWVDGANGSPRPEQVGRCRVCGETYRSEGTAA